MPIEVVGPDGKMHTFADDTPNDQINAQMSKVYGGEGTLNPAEGLQTAGQQTSAMGAIMPNMQTVPPYQSKEDWGNIAMSQLLPGAAAAIQNTPGHKYRMTMAEQSAKNLSGLEERQRAGVQVLQMLGQLGHTADEGHAAGTLDQAIGPVDSSPLFQRVRAALPVVGNYYEKPYNLHNQLTHDIHGLTTAFVSAAGKSGITMSDARQAAFEETMGAMMKATNKQEFDKIKVDAERIIANTFGLESPPIPKKRGEGHGQQQAPERFRQTFRNQQTGALEEFEWTGTQWQKVK